MARWLIRMTWFAAPSVVMLFGLLNLARAADSADGILKQKGLRRLNTTFVQVDELELSKQMRELAQFKRIMFAARKQESTVDKRAQAFAAMAAQARLRRSELRKQLIAARNAQENNRIVAALEELDDQIKKIDDLGPDGKDARAAEAAETKAREAYVEAVLNVRKLHDQVAENYEQLKKDPDVKAAIAHYNANAEKQAALGPSSAFLHADALIKKSEAAVLSEKIPLRQGNDRLLYVKAVFPGSHIIELAVDTGASSVVLPAAMAADIGVTQSPSDVAVKVQVADGREVEATRTVLSKVRIGQFEAENVECIILPASMKDAGALLGQSFLRHFSYKLDAATSTLTMTKVE